MSHGWFPKQKSKILPRAMFPLAEKKPQARCGFPKH
jgi:hypothetical protein